MSQIVAIYNIVSKETIEGINTAQIRMGDDESIDTLIEELKRLQVRETDLLGQLESAYRRRDGASTPRRRTGRHQVGDRVHVTNRIRRPVFAPASWTGFKERHATVTSVDGERVFFKTDNGTNTWRAAKNLRLL